MGLADDSAEHAHKWEAMGGRRMTISCNQCEAIMINGIFCHETGCPNAHKTWIEDREDWVHFIKCHQCGYDVEAGTTCDCQEEEENA